MPREKTAQKPSEECRKAGLKLFFYHSHLDWYRPDYHPRAKTGRNTGRPKAGDFDRYLDYMKRADSRARRRRLRRARRIC